ncbi:MAG: hypothetical protein ABII90_10305 [Bacteroidota bacterium]
MKKIILVFILINPLISEAQTTYKNLEKYWYYRLRLQNDFLKVGPNQGESIPAEVRFTNGQLLWDDPTQSLGWYIGVLATEFRLLDDNNESTLATEEELYYALNAFERLDFNAEIHFKDNDGNFGTPEYNGFFIRDDVPGDFISNISDPDVQGYDQEAYENYLHFNSGLTNSITVHTINSGLCSLQGIDCEKCKNPYPCNEVSQDQIFHLLIGLALVERFVNTWITYNGINFWEKAREITDRIIEYAKEDGWYIKNAVSGDNVGYGESVVLRSYALAAAGHKITGEYYQDGVSTFNYLTWQYTQLVVGPMDFPFNINHKAALAAVGDS